MNFIDDRAHMHRVNTEYMWQMRKRVVPVTLDTALERQSRLEPLDCLRSPFGRVGERSRRRNSRGGSNLEEVESQHRFWISVSPYTRRFCRVERHEKFSN